MRTVKSITAMRHLSQKWRRAGIKIGFVPTMGYLHDGHLSLVRCARQAVGKKGIVVVSIYVNPTQFGPAEDFSKYPRDLRRDLKLLHESKADVVFAPNDAEMYPNKSGNRFSTYIVEEKLSHTMEGKSRPTHFRGVTTVVAKLFNIVEPDTAVFGQKDFQQAAIIKRMVADLNLSVQIIVSPTIREPDGLAMSSRNKYLVGDLRRQSTVLWCAIEMARATVNKSKTFPAVKLKVAVEKLVECEPDTRLDYVEFFESETLSPVSKVARGTQMALAIYIGKTRLIDNARL